MATAHLAKQIVATIPTRIGLLADVTAAISQAGVSITAISAYERDGEGKFLLVTSDNAKATEALGRLNASVKEKGVLLLVLEDLPGALGAASKKLAEADINIDYSYGTTAGGSTAVVVLSTSDDQKALGLF